MKKLTNVQKYDDSNEIDKLIIQTFSKLDKIALGTSIGTLFGLIVFIATNFLILKGGEVIGPNLALLSQYFIGYSVTLTGSIIGLLYGFLTGFIIGWLIAFMRNLVVNIYFNFLKFKNNMSTINEYIDNP